jgi:hypothetical protein
MTQEEIETIAQRPTYCKADGEAVTLSRAERDALVAMTRDGARYQDFRAALTSMDTTWLDKVGAALEAMGLDPDDDVLPTAEQVDAAFDAAMAKESP